MWKLKCKGKLEELNYRDDSLLIEQRACRGNGPVSWIIRRQGLAVVSTGGSGAWVLENRKGEEWEVSFFSTHHRWTAMAVLV